jgi:hypothetical protein
MLSNRDMTVYVLILVICIFMAVFIISQTGRKSKSGRTECVMGEKEVGNCILSDTSLTCGHGTQTHNPKQISGHCREDDLRTYDRECTIECPTQPDCSYESYGACEFLSGESCGENGTQTRSQTPSQSACVGEATETISCDVPCPPCSYVDYGDCIFPSGESCGENGTKTRSQTPSQGACVGDTTETISCDVTCPPCSYVDDGECVPLGAPCGVGGHKEQSRTEDQGACTGPLMQSVSCSAPCDIVKYILYPGLNLECSSCWLYDHYDLSLEQSLHVCNLDPNCSAINNNTLNNRTTFFDTNYETDDWSYDYDTVMGQDNLYVLTDKTEKLPPADWYIKR